MNADDERQLEEAQARLEQKRREAGLGDDTAHEPEATADDEAREADVEQSLAAAQARLADRRRQRGSRRPNTLGDIALNVLERLKRTNSE